MGNQEEMFVKAKHLVSQTLLSTGFPFWLLCALLDSVKAELLEGLYRNTVISKEVEVDASAGPVE